MLVIDKTTKILFYPFYRRVGNPSQRLIRNIREFEKFLIENNGINDCFIAVYDIRHTIDKIFFDLDILDIKLAGKFYNYLRELGFSVIPVFSGKKGFHFYVPLKPMRFEDRNEAIAWLRKVSYTWIDESGLYRKEKHYKVPLFDTRIIGDINRLTRVPNTLRPPENITYCTYLPEDFETMTLEELFEHAKQPHEYNYEIKRKCKITEIETSDAIYDYLVTYNPVEFEVPDSYESHLERIDVDVRKYLKYLLRPCIYTWLLTEEPPHDIRTAATIDLLHADFTPEEIIYIYSRLKWTDWDERKTRYHVYKIASKTWLKPYSCKRLKELGYCLGKECDW